MAKKKNKPAKLYRKWDKYSFKHTTIAIILVSLFVLMLDTAIVQGLLTEIIKLGYLGIFFSGVLLVSFFTAAPAVVLLINFAAEYNPVVVALIGGLGAMLGDWLILRFAEDQIARELKPVAKKLKLISFINLLHKKRYKLVTATVGSIIIASPLPDEAGVALLGLSHISTLQLLGVTFALNAAGILAILMVFG